MLGAISAIALFGLAFSSSALAAGGSAMAWGSNSRGQVGNGTTSSGGCSCVPAPAAVTGLANAAEIAAGGETALALLADGSVVGWGDNFYGQIGNGGADSPVPVPATRVPKAIAVAEGAEHSLALLANGTVLAWGTDARGQLGVPLTGLEACFLSPCRKTPAPVPGLSSAIAISTSASSNLALLADGTVMAWGEDNAGQAGDGTGTTAECRCVIPPVAVPGVKGAVAISAGAEGGAALLADGTVKTWGFNAEGEIGNGTMTPLTGCSCVGPTAVPGLAGVKELAAGNRHHLALLAGGTLDGWGAGNVGQLGGGSAPSSVPTPTAVPGLTSVRAVAAGGFHSLALLDSGAVSAWGYNVEGPIGDGTTEQRNSPKAVAGVAGASAVSGNGETSYALIGPSQTLNVALAGAGSGTVGTSGLLCPGICSARYPQSQVKILRAEAASGSAFAGFSGPCAGTGPCQVKLDSDQTVTATFGPPKGTAITSTTVDQKKRSASFSFSAPGAITGYECELISPVATKTKHKKKRHHKHKKHHGKGKAQKKAKATPKPVAPVAPSFSACGSPASYAGLKTAGTYSFQVRALDSLGADANPAVGTFTLKKPKAKKHHKRKKHRGHKAGNKP